LCRYFAATEEDMKCAADLAAFHSKLRTGGKVDVSWWGLCTS
jgi:predicted ribosome quality control (RQC) complex YloA/Tae2 family protein